LASFGQAVSEEKIFLTLANQKKELILVAMFARRMEPNKYPIPYFTDDGSIFFLLNTPTSTYQKSGIPQKKISIKMTILFTGIPTKSFFSTFIVRCNATAIVYYNLVHMLVFDGK
jgi:hypothetical protein